MRFTAVAVQTGATALRVAGIEHGGPPRLIAQMSGGATHGLAALLAQLVGPAPDELLLVHPGHWSAERAVGWARGAADLAGRVRTVAAPVAAAAATGTLAVLDVGHTGADAALVHRGGVRSLRRVPVGGARLDEAVLELLGAPEAVDDEGARAEARRVREALSLQPTVLARTPRGRVRVDAEQLRAALRPWLAGAVSALADVLDGMGGTPVPVLLTGGVARTPLLAELMDAAGIRGARVAAPPDTAAVLGALALGAPAVDGAVDVVAPPSREWLPPAPMPARHRLRTAATALAAVGVGGALLGVGTLLPAPLDAPLAVAEASVVPPGVLVQYGYRLDMPTGWEHSGGMPERRRSLLTPVATPEGSDLVVVERSPLGYDAGAEPERARTELRAVFDEAVAGGAAMSDYVATGSLAGRDVTTYREAARDNTVVDWYVVLDGDAQFSVGCRHTRSGTEAVRAACEVVVGSIRRS